MNKLNTTLSLWHELNLDLGGGWRLLNTQMAAAFALDKDVWRVLMTSWGFFFFPSFKYRLSAVAS